MKRTWVVVMGVMWVAVASAKPLPRGLKIETLEGKLVAKQGATTAVLGDLDDYDMVTKAELSADGKTVEVTTDRCGGTATGDALQLPLVSVQARLDNAAGLAALAKKQYAPALKLFQSALKKTPDSLEITTNVLAAQLLGKKTTQAAQTFALNARKNPVWFAWQIAVDPNLAGATSLKQASELLVAPERGTATVAALGERDLATSPLAGGIAAVRTISKRDGSAPSLADIEFVSLATGKVLARMPLVMLRDNCQDATQPCEGAAAATIATRTQLVDNVLAALGFTIVPNAFIDMRNGDPVTKNGIEVAVSDTAVTASKGGRDAVLETDSAASFIALLPGALVAKVSHHRPGPCGASWAYEGTSAIALP